MPDRLPPLNALRAFEATARHLSITDAAAELAVTPAAVSQQIKALEKHLGVQLFHRHNRALTLTPAARAGLDRLSQGFTNLGTAVEQIRGQRRLKQLMVWAAPSFAVKWLIPRLQDFTATHPEIDLRLLANINLIDDSHGHSEQLVGLLQHNAIDLAIVFGRGHYPGCRVDRLLSVQVVPLCSPRLLNGAYPLRHPADLRHHTLLHDDTDYEGRPDWTGWLATAGVQGLAVEGGLHFNHVSMALAAAIDGQGVVLSLLPLAERDIAAGRLVIPFAPAIPLAQAYYLVSPEQTAELPPVVAFRRWLLAQTDQRQPSAV